MRWQACQGVYSSLQVWCNHIKTGEDAVAISLVTQSQLLSWLGSLLQYVKFTCTMHVYRLLTCVIRYRRHGYRTDSVLEMERHSELFVKALSVCELMAQQPALRVLLLLPTRHTKLSLLADQKCDDDHKVCTRL